MQVREHLALERFIESLNDGDMEWTVFQAKPRGIDQAVETALEFEAFRHGQRCRMGEKHFVWMNIECETCSSQQYPECGSYTTPPYHVEGQETAAYARRCT